MITPKEKQDYGEAGALNETGTTAITGKDFCRIDCLTDTVFASLTEVALNAAGTGDAITGITLPAGTSLRGKFTGFTLTSGAVRAYFSASRS